MCMAGRGDDWWVGGLMDGWAAVMDQAALHLRRTLILGAAYMFRLQSAGMKYIYIYILFFTAIMGAQRAATHQRWMFAAQRQQQQWNECSNCGVSPYFERKVHVWRLM